MVYLIKSAYLDENDEPKKCLKIGYAKNIDDRMIGYGTHNNLTVSLLKTIEGDLFFENLYHNFYKNKILKIRGNREWMEYDEEIIEQFGKISNKELLISLYSNLGFFEKKFGTLFIEFFYNEDIFALDFLKNDKNLNDFIDLFRVGIFHESDLEGFLNSLDLSYRLVEFKKFMLKQLSIPSLNILIFGDQIKELSDDLIIYPIFKKDSDLSEAVINTEIEKSLKVYQEKYENESFFVDKIKILCSMLLDSQIDDNISKLNLSWISRDHRNYLNYLGPERIKALGYVELDLKRELLNVSSSSLIKKELINYFIIGKRYSLKEIKEILRDIYINLSLTKTPKASDLEDYFEVRLVKFYDLQEAKRVKGYEILSLKE